MCSNSFVILGHSRRNRQHFPLPAYLSHRISRGFESRKYHPFTEMIKSDPSPDSVMGRLSILHTVVQLFCRDQDQMVLVQVTFKKVEKVEKGEES